MTPAEIKANFANYDEILTADGFDDALIGVVDGACREPVACYDYQACVEILMTRDGMSEEDAEEYLSFNVIGAYCGEYTPLFVHDWRREETIDFQVEMELEEVEDLREQAIEEQRKQKIAAGGEQPPDRDSPNKDNINERTNPV